MEILRTSYNGIDINLPNIQLDEEQKAALELMENSLENIFLSGDAGTGKSTILKYFLATTRKKTIILASTGVAAVNVGGQTIHSFFRFPPKPLNHDDIQRLFNGYKMLRQIDTIIIDEASMIRVDVMDAIDQSLRLNLSTMEPLAGKQLILVGDLNQLPPVTGTLAERQMLSHRYKSEFFFDAHVFSKSNLVKIILKNVKRQKDPEFVNILNSIKGGKATQEMIAFLNQKCMNNPNVSRDDICLCTTNDISDQMNYMKLMQIQSPVIKLQSTFDGRFDSRNSPIPPDLDIKVGCRLMSLSNHPNGYYFNGSIGTLVDAYDTDTPDGKLVIDFGNGPIEMAKKEFGQQRYTYDKDKEKIDTEILGSVTGFPVKLAYAISIHKSQGQTFQKMNLDMGRGAFASGQLYVALSRSVSMDGLSLVRPISLSDVILDKRILDFLSVQDGDYLVR